MHSHLRGQGRQYDRLSWACQLSKSQMLASMVLVQALTNGAVAVAPAARRQGVLRVRQQRRSECRGALPTNTHLKNVIRKPKPAGHTQQVGWYTTMQQIIYETYFL